MGDCFYGEPLCAGGCTPGELPKDQLDLDSLYKQHGVCDFCKKPFGESAVNGIKNLQTGENNLVCDNCYRSVPVMGRNKS